MKAILPLGGVSLKKPGTGEGIRAGSNVSTKVGGVVGKGVSVDRKIRRDVGVVSGTGSIVGVV